MEEEFTRCGWIGSRLLEQIMEKSLEGPLQVQGSGLMEGVGVGVGAGG